MLQSHLMEVGIFGKELELFGKLVAVEHSPEIVSSISSIFCLSKCIFYKNVSYKGTDYFINNFVVLEKQGCDLNVGKIICIFNVIMLFIF